jgi:hypothetical protein
MEVFCTSKLFEFAFVEEWWKKNGGGGIGNEHGQLDIEAC